MPKPDAPATVKNLDRRLVNVEQILPTLATRDQMNAAIAPLTTRDEMNAAIAPLATRDEMNAAIAPLATRDEMNAAIAPLATRKEMHAAIAAAVAPLATRDEVRAEAVETRRHIDVVFESMRAEIRLFAQGQIHLTERADTFEAKTERAITNLDRRVLRLEAERHR